MPKNKKIYIAGASGMVGSALMRKLKSEGYSDILTSRSSELDLRCQSSVAEFFEKHKPDMVVIAAAKVGGIMANDTYRADFIYDNLQIELNLINSSKNIGVEKLIFLGSSCIYPKEAKQPIKEEYLLDSKLEYTNEPYAVAKIAGLKMCESYYKQHGCNFYSLMPCNLYGINDNFDLKTSHVFPAFIRKFHEAKKNNLDAVEIWGSGKPRREFMFVDDVADTLEKCLRNIDASAIYDLGISHLNIGAGTDVSILELANLISDVVGFEGKLKFDSSKPDGTMKKLMDVSLAEKFDIRPSTNLKDGIEKTYDWFCRLSAHLEGHH